MTSFINFLKKIKHDDASIKNIFMGHFSIHYIKYNPTFESTINRKENIYYNNICQIILEEINNLKFEQQYSFFTEDITPFYEENDNGGKILFSSFESANDFSCKTFQLKEEKFTVAKTNIKPIQNIFISSVYLLFFIKKNYSTTNTIYDLHVIDGISLMKSIKKIKDKEETELKINFYIKKKIPNDNIKSIIIVLKKILMIRPTIKLKYQSFDKQEDFLC